MGKEYTKSDKLRTMVDDLLEDAGKLNRLKAIHASNEKEAVQKYIIGQWDFTEEELTNIEENIAEMLESVDPTVAATRYWV